MVDREKVIKALECCAYKQNCIECPYYKGNSTCMDDKDKDALELLKEQEPKQIVRKQGKRENTRPLVLCKDCKNLIDHYGFMDDGYCKKMREDYNAKLKPKKDWFCADGERKDK